MADILIKKLKQEIAKQRFNYKSLSLAAGLGETTVRDIMIGRARNPRRDTLQKIARTLGLSTAYFLGEGERVPLYGSGAPQSKKASAFYEHSPATLECEMVETPPEIGYRDLAAVRISGNAMLPFLPEGSVIYYHQPRESGFNDWIGKICVLQMIDGPLKVHILKPGPLYGKYNLESYNAKTIKNVKLEWCARALFIKQG